MMLSLQRNGKKAKSCPGRKKKRFCELPVSSFLVSVNLKPLNRHGLKNVRPLNLPGASLSLFVVSR
nr:hypothetical protein [uncultured bacterium]